MFNIIYRKILKRILDLILSLVMCFFLLLPMFIIAVIIRADSSGGAIFRQRRIGKDGAEFVCYKFRTMRKDTPSDLPASSIVDHNIYVTRVGKFLRKSSLDELPQLFNVIRGDMSLVGPRPLISAERDIHDKRLSGGIYSLRPGITGMAQISGRNLLDNSEKLERDAYYLQNMRFALDAQIIFATMSSVIKREGIERED